MGCAPVILSLIACPTLATDRVALESTVPIASSRIVRFSVDATALWPSPSGEAVFLASEGEDKDQRVFRLYSFGTERFAAVKLPSPLSEAELTLDSARWSPDSRFVAVVFRSEDARLLTLLDTRTSIWRWVDIAGSSGASPLFDSTASRMFFVDGVTDPDLEQRGVFILDLAEWVVTRTLPEWEIDELLTLDSQRVIVVVTTILGQTVGERNLHIKSTDELVASAKPVARWSQKRGTFEPIGR